MATPSHLTRPAREEAVLPAGPDTAPATTTAGLVVRVVARVRAILAERSDSRLAQLVAGKVFLLRVANAMIALGSQVLLARWMGRFEFGIYIYVWTWVLMIGSLSDVGLSIGGAALHPRIYRARRPDCLARLPQRRTLARLRVATAIAAVGAIGVTLLGPGRQLHRHSALSRLRHHPDLPASAQLQTGIAQTYDWPMLALVPFFIGRQVAAHGGDRRGLVRSVTRSSADHGDDLRHRGHLGGDRRAARAAQPPARRHRAEGPEALRAAHLARHLAADPGGGRLLPDAHLRRHPGARALPLAGRGRGLLRRRAHPGGGRLRLFRHRRRHHAQVHAILRRRQPRAAGELLQRDHPLDLLAVACRLRG